MYLEKSGNPDQRRNELFKHFLMSNAISIFARVTRLGEFSPIVRLLTWNDFFKTTEVGQNSGSIFTHLKLCINFVKKNA
jgi:hypothetical protein